MRRTQPRSPDPDELVGLQTQSPLGMLQTIPGGGRGIGGAIRIVHRLQEEIAEILSRETLRRRTGLWIDQLPFIATHQFLFGLGPVTDAYPVNARRRKQGAVGFNTDLETL